MTDQRVVPGPHRSRFSVIQHVVETGSTNADLLARAAEGAAEGAVLVTDHQTAGRGRQARTWHDEPGNAMLMSVLLRPPVTLAPLMPLLAGLAVTDGAGALVSLEPGQLALKWPNDVLVPELDERKLAGILTEATSRGAAPGTLAVVVGMGLNLRWASPPPAELSDRAATLEQVAGRPLDRWDVARSVLDRIEAWLARAERDGPSVVLDEYRQRCLTLGREIRLQRQNDTIEGRAVAIADGGALVVETEAGPVTVTAGDAHHV